MPTDVTATAADTNRNLDDLRANLRQADVGILVAVLAQLTGDPTVVDRFAARISHVPDPPEHNGVTDPDTLEELVEAVVAATRAPRPDGALPADDPDLFARIAPVALGTPVGSDYVGLLLEQGGFHPSQPVLPRAARLPHDFKAVVIGAGIAGMAAALELSDAGIDYEIIERNAEVGGTWYTTVYPGIGVDTPSAYYSLSRDINANWSSYYPQGDEYQQYLLSVADKNGLREHTRFSTDVTALWWDADRDQWQVHTVGPDGAAVSYANVVIPAAGYLNRPRWPELAGRDTFGGVSIHSAQWDPELDLTGKRVAVIGAGCTAVQIVDACVEQVEHLTVFQRQPHWVAPRKRLTDDVPEHRRWLNNHVPFYANWNRLKSFWGTADNNHPVILRDPQWAAQNRLSISKANDVLLQLCLDYIDRTFGAGSELAAKVTPDFAPYGKRIIRDPGGYYAALTRPHVDVEAAEPARVNERGIITQDGRQIDLDVIVYATGYHLDFLSTVDIRGRDGVELAKVWGDNPSAYRGGMVPGFPNMFISSAPNYSPGHGAGHNFGVEIMVHYAMECLQLMALRDAATIEVTPEAFTDYVREIDEAMADTVWCHTPTAHTYYRSGGGRIVTAFPFRLLDMWQTHRAPVEEDLILR